MQIKVAGLDISAVYMDFQKQEFHFLFDGSFKKQLLNNTVILFENLFFLILKRVVGMNVCGINGIK